MLTSITHSAVFVLDQDEALDFYVGKLGMEVSADVDLGVMRWLTVCIPGDDRHILLEKPGPPGQDPATAEQTRDLVTKGGTGLGFIVTTDDCRAAYEALRERGVEFTGEPEEHFYGTDVGFRDPFGNNMRLTQLSGRTAPTPEEAEEMNAWMA